MEGGESHEPSFNSPPWGGGGEEDESKEGPEVDFSSGDVTRLSEVGSNLHLILGFLAIGSGAPLPPMGVLLEVRKLFIM